MTDRIKDISTATANRISGELGLVTIGAQSPGDAVGNVARLISSGRDRAIKRRPKAYPLLMKPRALAREEIRKHGHARKVK